MSFAKVSVLLLCVVHHTFAARVKARHTVQPKLPTPLDPSRVIAKLQGGPVPSFAGPSVRDQFRALSKQNGGECVQQHEGSVTQAEVEAMFSGSKVLPPDERNLFTSPTRSWEAQRTSHVGKFALSPAAQAMYDKLNKMAEAGEIDKHTVLHGTKGPKPKDTLNPLKMAGIVARKSPKEKLERVLASIASGGFRYASRAAKGPGVYTAGEPATAWKFATESNDDIEVCGAFLTLELFGGKVDSNDMQVGSWARPEGAPADWKIVCEPVMLFPVSYAIVGYDPSCGMVSNRTK